MTKQTRFTYFLDTVALLLLGLIPLADHFHLDSMRDRMLLVMIIAAIYGLIFLGRHIYQSALAQEEPAIKSREIVSAEVDGYYLKPPLKLITNSKRT